MLKQPVPDLFGLIQGLDLRILVVEGDHDPVVGGGINIVDFTQLGFDGIIFDVPVEVMGFSTGFNGITILSLFFGILAEGGDWTIEGKTKTSTLCRAQRTRFDRVPFSLFNACYLHGFSLIIEGNFKIGVGIDGDGG